MHGHILSFSFQIFLDQTLILGVHGILKNVTAIAKVLVVEEGTAIPAHGGNGRYVAVDSGPKESFKVSHMVVW